MTTIKLDDLDAVLLAYVSEAERELGEVELERLEQRRAATERFEETEAGGRVEPRYRDERRNVTTTAARP